MTLCISHPRPGRWKAALVLWSLLAAVLVSNLGTAVGRRYQFALNETESLPNWGFVIDHSQRTPRRGDLFAFVPPSNPYYPAGMPFTKRVVGLPGDRISVEGRAFFINGVHVGDAKPADRSGRPVAMTSPGIIPADRYFLVTGNPDSLDSRYSLIGLIDRRRLLGRAQPVM